MTKVEFILNAVDAAKRAGHVWPEYAACEAALESRFGMSVLAAECNNLFGQKRGFTSKEYPIQKIPTFEWEAKAKKADGTLGDYVKTMAEWPKFPDWATAFSERMELLTRSRLYASAMAQTTGADFVKEVSKVWASDPHRGEKVLVIYNQYKSLWEKPRPQQKAATAGSYADTEGLRVKKQW